MTFPTAVKASPRLREHFREGLSALGGDSKRVAMKDTRAISGSVNVEVAQKAADGQENAWDFGVGIKRTGGEEAIWIEVHSADTRHVQPMLDKLQSLRTFLRKIFPTSHFIAVDENAYTQ